MKCAQLAQHGDLLDQFGARVRVLGRLDLLRPDVLAAVNRVVDLTSQNGERILNVCFPYTSRDEITTAIRNTVADYSKPLEPTATVSSSRMRFSESRIALNVEAQAQGAKAEERANGISESDPTPSVQKKEEAPSPKSDGKDDETATTDQDKQSGKDHLTDDSTPTSTGNGPVFVSPETISSKTLTDHMFTKGNPPVDLLIRTSSVRRLSDFMLWQCHENTEIVILDVMWPDFDLWHFLPVLLRWQRRVTKARRNPDGEGDFEGYASNGSYDGSADGLLLHPNGKIKST